MDYVQYAYDVPNIQQGTGGKGLLTKKSDGNGHETDYVYDADNRPIETVRPDNSQTFVTYDPDSNVKTRLDANGITTTYTYDNDDRLTNVVYTQNGTSYTANGTNDVAFTYYPDSKIQTMSKMIGGRSDITTWTYDNAGNTLSIGGGRGTISYQYYENNLRSRMSEASSFENGIVWNYAYDDANRPAGLTDPFGVLTQFGFDMADRLTTKTFPYGTVTTTTYDTTDEVQDISTTKNGGATVLAESSYTYDPAGDVTTRTDNDGTVASFFYNGADQLTTENYLQSGSNYPLSYTYDNNGNRTTQNYNGVVTSYAYDYGDRLTSDSNGGAYSYDANGNWTKLVSGANTYTFQYDAENHLTYYQSPTGFTTYYYNGMGLRVAEYDSGTEHDLLNDGAAPGSSLLIDHNLGTQTTSEVYTPGIDQRDGLGGALHIMGVDALGTVRAFVNDDSRQAVTDTFGAYAYGIPRTRTGSDAFTFAFAGADGYQTDPNGLMLLGNRVYHPYTGRFLTRDPAHAGLNDYEYTDNNPLIRVDPSGLQAQPFSVAPDETPAQVEAQTERNGGLPGETYDVKDGQGNVLYSFTIAGDSEAMKPGNGWTDAENILRDFINGTGSRNRTYSHTSTQSEELRYSAAYFSILSQIVQGKKSGFVSTKDAAVNTFWNFANGTQAQVGGFAWSLVYTNGSATGIDITNTLSFNSLAYHGPQVMNDMTEQNDLGMVEFLYNVNLHVPEQWSGGHFGDINQTFHLDFP